ncbi:hypothetical protein ACFOD0_04235 [Shewanella intestini]|uniref:Zinc resistance-associated protein n=1 Tax=Shewanella intestini TaxID=2017544 RepID=A0ABS5I0G1_9GAMM|nr:MULTISPECIES: hypothetical protein [Shewanella]MBR9727511.1 hypothetical protein [Shewanella intestini]MRG35339.1 hypothetical protein [Shewanella sp. XMDDZSB0408]
MNLKMLVALVGINLCLVGYLAFSGPYEIRVTPQGELIGFGGKLKELAQGREFWVKQLQLVEREIRWERTQPQRQAELLNGLNEINAEVEYQIASYRNDYPGEVMSQAELLREQANSLSQQANHLEREQINSELERYRLVRIQELVRTQSAIKQRLVGF